MFGWLRRRWRTLCEWPGPVPCRHAWRADIEIHEVPVAGYPIGSGLTSGEAWIIGQTCVVCGEHRDATPYRMPRAG